MNRIGAATAKELFFLSGDGSLVAADVEKGFETVSPTQLFRVPIRRGSEGPLYAAAHDGRRFLLIVGDFTESPDTIDVVLNWPGLIRR